MSTNVDLFIILDTCSSLQANKRARHTDTQIDNVSFTDTYSTVTIKGEAHRYTDR